MPKPSALALIWSEEHQHYELHLNRQLHQSFRHQDESAWLTWLHEQTTVAFQGQAGHLSLIREARPRGSSYWYAYRRQAGRTYKRYLGSSARLTFAHLEQIATELTRSSLSSSTQALVPEVPLSSEPSSSLLSAKLSAPRLPSWLVGRSRLLRELEAVCMYPLTLVSASAGSGKTTLLSDWMATAQEAMASQSKRGPGKQYSRTAFAWLSLDALEGEPTRFWTSVITALRTVMPTVGQTAFALLHSQEAPPLSTILTNLLGELEQRDAEIILILDDYQVISDHNIHESMLFMLENLPTNVHLVLATRSDPALPLSRFRMRGQLLELRDHDLRFRLDEATNFLMHGMGLPLTDEEVAILHTRTEGWIAGLQLAALFLRKREDRAKFVKGFAGSFHYLLDYVQQDILAQLPAPLLAFLLQTTILPRMNAAICQAVTLGSTLQASQQMLEDLERANLFVVPLDDERKWYRYHDLFREVLQVRLQANHPELIPQLHERAARFYEATGELREAITHALAAADYPYAARLMEQEAPHLWLSGEAQTVAKWIAVLPDADLWQHSPLALTTMLRILEPLHSTEEAVSLRTQALVEPTIARLETLLGRQEKATGEKEREKPPTIMALTVIRRRLRLLRVLIEMIALLKQRDTDGLAALARELEQLDQDEEFRWNIISLTITFWLVESFQREGALLLPLLLEAKQQALKAGDELACLRVLEWLAFAYLRAGQWHMVERECQTGLALVEQGGGRTIWAGYLHHFLFSAYYAWNRLGEAAATVQQLLQIARDWQQMDLLIMGYLDLAKVELTRGHLVAADQALHQAEALTRQERFAFHALRVAETRARYWLAAGNLEAARHWAEEIVFEPRTWDPNHKEALLTQIRVLLVLHHTLEALGLLDRFKAQLERPGDPYRAQEFLASSVVALQQAGKWEQAQIIASRLLAMTEAGGSLRVYLDAGPSMKQVLQMLLADPPVVPTGVGSATVSRYYVSQLLVAFEQEAGSNAPLSSSSDASSLFTKPGEKELSAPEVQGQEIDRLSVQEYKVLRLLVAGQTYAEMAEMQVVSLNTIKTQVNAIYRKLGVSSRAQAIAVARQGLGL